MRAPLGGGQASESWGRGPLLRTPWFCPRTFRVCQHVSLSTSFLIPSLFQGTYSFDEMPKGLLGHGAVEIRGCDRHALGGQAGPVGGVAGVAKAG